MEEKTLINNIKAVANKLRDSKLKRIATANAAIDAVAASLTLANAQQAIAFVAIFDRQCADLTTGFDELAHYFQCSPIEAVEFAPAISAMADTGLVEVENPKERSMIKRRYIIAPDVFAAILEDRKIPQVAPMKKEKADQFDFIKDVEEVLDDFCHENITYFACQRDILQLEGKNKDLPFVKSATAAVPDMQHRMAFYRLCAYFIENPNREVDLNYVISAAYSGINNRSAARRAFLDYTHFLTAANLVELRNEDDLALLDDGIYMIYGENAKAYLKPYKGLTRYQFFSYIYDIIEDQHNPKHYISFRRSVRKTMEVEGANPQLAFVGKLKDVVPEGQDRLLLYLIAREVVNGATYTIGSDLENLHEKSACMRIAKQFKLNEHILQQRGLVEFQQGGMFDSANLILTDLGKEMLLEEDADLFMESTAKEDIIDPADIVEKRLFFDPKLQRQLAMLSDSLQEAKFQAMRARLKEKGMPTGIATLLYGVPGTGKTESVMQIARATGRAVMHVDISATKTCWFGESEKLIKEVFNKYKRLCKKSKLTPILLFNEADAVFSKRKDANSSNVAQTENAIQNIILEQMENLDGILIATTNIAENLDAAFERRFLFKIKYENPSVEAKRTIWLDKMPTLTEKEASHLAGNYNFSGGEIDNIVRKATMAEILSGAVPDLKQLVCYCEEEKIASKRAPVGF